MRPPHLLVVLTMSLAPGCADDTFEIGAGPGADAGLDAGSGAPVLAPADVLFVVDNSGSMAGIQAELAEAFEGFARAVAGAGRFRFGVVSMDLQSMTGEWSGQVRTRHAATAPFTVAEIDRSQCALTETEHGCFWAPGLLDSSELETEDLVRAFRSALDLGTCGSGNEEGLLSMLRALELDGCSGQAFIRAEANLLIVLVSDEEEASEIPIADVVSRLALHKPLEQIRVATITGAWDGSAAACAPEAGTACGSLCDNPPPEGSLGPCTRIADCPAGEFCDHSVSACKSDAYRYWTPTNCSWCTFYNTPDCCTAVAWTRYVEFARAFEAAAAAQDPSIPVVGCDGRGARPICLVESVCQDDLRETLTRIANRLLLARD